MKPDYISIPDWKLLTKKYLDTNKLLELLSTGCPPQYLIGNVEFCGNIINVDERVLIPRFETETLVDKTINYAKEMFNKKISIIDLGTGSGCIAISLKKNLDSFVTALDISSDALEVAESNALLNNTEINFINKSMTDSLNNNYDIIISMIDGADVSQIQRLEANRKVDGIIVSRAVVSSKVQKYLKNCKEPYILIGPSSDPEVPFVDNKNQEAGKELTSIMLMKGFRNLALLGGNQSYNVTGSRYQGFLEAHEEMGVSVNENLIFMDTNNQAAVSDAVKRLLEEGADGIVCMDDVICSMCLSSLREKKISVPEEIKIASMYDSKNLEYNNPPITSIRFDTVRLGKMACAKLLNILGEKPLEDTLTLNYQVMLRESTQ